MVKLNFKNGTILIMISACIWIRGIQLYEENPVPHHASNIGMGSGIGNARFVWWYKRVARPKNGGRRWKSESSWVPFGNGEFGVNIIAVWRHVNATAWSLTFTSDSVRYIYDSSWLDQSHPYYNACIIIKINHPYWNDDWHICLPLTTDHKFGDKGVFRLQSWDTN